MRSRDYLYGEHPPAELHAWARGLVIDPPLASDHCVCPQHHPHIWADDP